LFAVRRADIESFARDLEERGRARATVTRRLSIIAGFYKYAVEEELLGTSPAAHVRRPRVDYESYAVALDRNELGALLVAAGLGSSIEHALISLLALNGLRVSGACRRRHRAPGPGARAPDPDHHPQGRQDRHHPARTAHRPGARPGHRRTHRRAGVPGRRRAAAGPARRRTDRPAHCPPRRDRQERHAPHAAARVITAALDAGVPLRDVEEAASHADPRTTMRYDRARGSLDRHATYIVAAYLAGAAR
jgi:integrase